MRHPEEGIIHAWLDGALPAAEAREIEAHVASCRECEARVAEARGLIAASSRIVGHLDTVPGGVIPIATTRPRRWLAWGGPLGVAVAAMLIFMLKGYDRMDEKILHPGGELTRQNPAVIEPTVRDSMPVVKPRGSEPPRVAVLDGPAGKKPVAAAPEVQLPPANAAAQKSSVVAAAPPAARPIEEASRAQAGRVRAEQLAEVAAASAAGARSLAGSAGGVSSGATMGAAPVAATDRLARRRDEPAASDSASVFAGCYESTSPAARTPASPAPQPRIQPPRGLQPSRAVLPPPGFADDERYDRFALLDDPAPTNGQLAVRTLDAEGRVGALIYGAGWSVLGNRATVRDSRGQIVVTLTWTDSTVRSATVRVVSCRK